MTDDERLYHRVYKRKVRAARRAKGLCPYCDTKTANGRSMCAYHIRWYANWRKYGRHD